MKTLKFLLQAASAVMLVIGFGSCGNDDDDDGCLSCTFTYNGQQQTYELCEEDYTQAEINYYVGIVEALGGSCN